VIDQGRMIAGGSPAELKAKVGGQTLDVRPVDRASLPAVAAIVAAATGPGAEPTVDSGGSLVSVPVPGHLAGSEVLAGVARRLDADGIACAELGLRLASLDEVFLMLTEAGANR
jgi:oleandomycin transport system ATP-binding protein